MVEPVVVPGAGPLHVDGREDAALDHFAVELDLHVAGALKLLENHLVHPALGLDQRRGDNGQAAALLDIARRTKKLAGPLQRFWIDAAGGEPRFPAAAVAATAIIVGAGQAGEAVEQDDHIAPVLDQPLGARDHDLRHLNVPVGHLIEGGGEDDRIHRLPEVSHFFRPLVEQEDHQFDFRMILADGHGDFLEQDGFSAARGGADQGALAFAERGQDIDDAGADRAAGWCFRG